jgi:hypothetical protein
LIGLQVAVRNAVVIAGALGHLLREKAFRKVVIENVVAALMDVGSELPPHGRR